MNPTDSVDPNDSLYLYDEILIYPNPINDYIYLGNIDSVKSIRVVDLLGKEFINIKEINSNQVNLSNLSIGAYFIIINEEKIFKILKE